MKARKKSGKIVEGLETYPSKAAMKKHEALESPAVEKQEEQMAMSMKRAKGGKMSMKKWEASAEDLSQDKKLAKKRGMSLEAWEKSDADKKHDAQQSMKGLKKGGSPMKLPMVPLQTDMAEKSPKKGGNLNAGTSGQPVAPKAKGKEGSLYSKGGKIGPAPEGKLYSKGGKMGSAPQGKLYQSGGYMGPSTRGRPMAKGGKMGAAPCNRLY